MGERKVGIIVQARMGSTRLPGKVMLDLQGKPVLQHIFERLKMCQNVNELILATTTNPQDNVLVALARENQVKVFRGSEDDVLARYYLAAEENKLDIVIRITSACPLIDPELIDQLILRFINLKDVDYFSQGNNRTFPRGLDVEILLFSALQKAYLEGHKLYEREHVIPYIYGHPEMFRLEEFHAPVDYSKYRLTLDTKEDYVLIGEIYDRLYPLNNEFGLTDIMKLLDSDHEMAFSNAHVKQKTLCE